MPSKLSSPLAPTADRAFGRLAILGGGPASLRLIQAARVLTREGHPALRTIALHRPGDARARHVCEADEAWPIPSATPAELRRALAATRADAVWSALGDDDLTGELLALCQRQGVRYLGQALLDARDAQVLEPAALTQLAARAGWPTEHGHGRVRRVELTLLGDAHGQVAVLPASDLTLRRHGLPVRPRFETSLQSRSLAAL